MDRRLHGERLDGRVQRRHQARWADLPDGAFVHTGQGPALICGNHIVGWTTAGYQAPEPRPVAATAVVLTPPATLAVLRHGYRPEIAFAAPVDFRRPPSPWRRLRALIRWPRRRRP